MRDTEKHPAQTYEWTPDSWQSWREEDNPYRRFKSHHDRQIALELLDPQPGDRILEAGCGYGWISREVWTSAPVDWVGVDRSMSMLRRLRASQSGMAEKSLIADACCLPFAGASFDRVLCTGVLMHIADVDAALMEMVRVLRPGGLLLCSVNSSRSPLSWIARAWNLRKPGFVQKFVRPAYFRERLQEFGLRNVASAGDGVFASVSIIWRSVSIPPRFLFPFLRGVDARLLARFPSMAYEVWFAAIKNLPCAS